jgi:hypothetical protein
MKFEYLFALVLISLCLLGGCSALNPDISENEITGVVLDEAQPVAGAVVRIKTTKIETVTEIDGSFSISGLSDGEPVDVTAWASGYYIAAAEDILPGTSDLKFELHPHHTQDNPDYDWLPSLYHEGEGENQGCAECHSSADANIGFTLPVDEWLQDAHASTASNPRFLTMYAGTDVNGNQSPETVYGSSRDYGTFPLPPDPDKPYYGPGYRLDFPDTDGNCAACHTPAAAVNDPYSTDPTSLSGVDAEGVPCDFCHKVWDVSLGADGLPLVNMPGVLSFSFLRPPDGHQFFAGPFDDVAPGEDTYSPLQQQSQFCAPCHFGVFWDTVVYNSYGEWLESPYSDVTTGKTCQDCHMPPIGANYFALPEQGGEVRDPETIFSHRMPGALDTDLLQNAVSMNVETKQDDDQLYVTVTITNDQTGHHVPTDSPLRHLILVVKAFDEEGSEILLSDGPVLPDWCGVGDPQSGNYAGLPGKVYIKLLQEVWTGIMPSGAYWNPTRVVSDTRLAALESDTSLYTFITPVNQKVTVEVSLLYRRAFLELMNQKGWGMPDILIESETKILP